MATVPWFIPTPDVLPVQRATLRLGLARSERFFRDVVAPGIGGVFFIRQLSWAIAGIAVAAEVTRQPASRIANAIEALACKLNHDDDRTEGRLRGIRAFARHPEAFSFAELSQRRHYVQVTFRQNTVGAISADTGLGFAGESSRFNAMACTAHGVELARAFLDRDAGRGGKSLRSLLRDWVARGDEIGPTHVRLAEALSPALPTDAERALVADRLQAMAARPPQGVSADRRAKLVALFAGRKREPTYEHVLKQVDETTRYQLELAEAFALLASAARDAVRATALALGRTARIPAGEVAAVPAVANALDRLRDHARTYRARAPKSGLIDTVAEALAFDSDTDEPTRRLIAVVQRDGIGLSCPDRRTIAPGISFDIVLRNARDHEAKEDEENGGRDDAGLFLTGTGLRLSRLSQLWALWQDCQEST